MFQQGIFFHHYPFAKEMSIIPVLQSGSALRSAVPAVCCGDADAIVSMSMLAGRSTRFPPEGNSLHLLAEKWHTELPR